MKFLCGITPENITELEPNGIFVFGSNLAGIHGAGAALQAVKFGANFGVGLGRTGQTYAIPTKDHKLNALNLIDIKIYIDEFYYYAMHMKSNQFLVTKIGCGLAGFKPVQIAPFFKDFTNKPNICLPQEFMDVIMSVSDMTT